MSTATNGNLVGTGIEGLDDILGGGLTRGQFHLVRGPSGAGKTTLALQFLLSGARRGEPCLYVGTNETGAELRAMAAAHGWTLEHVATHHHKADEVSGQTVLHAAEAELPHAIDAILAAAERSRPTRVAIDSLSEIQLLARERAWYYHHLSRLKDRFARAGVTALLTEIPTPVSAVASSLVCSIIELATTTPPHGVDRHRLRIAKVRARPFAAGWHDYRIVTGGLEVYPSLTTVPHAPAADVGLVPTGVPGLDGLLGGGLARGASALLVGDSGSGKTLAALQFALAAAQRQERVSICAFDECARSLLHSAGRLGLPLAESVDAGLVRVREIVSSAFTSGWFAHLLRQDVRDGVQHVVLDSLNGYRYAMATGRARVRLHELLSFLNRQMVTTVTIAGHDWLAPADPAQAVDLSYIADTVITFENRPCDDEIHPAIRILKRRGGPHDRGVHRLAIGAGGVRLDGPLHRSAPTNVPMPRHTGAFHG